MSDDTIDYKKLAEALAEALEQRNLWIEGEEYRELVILRMRLSKKVESLAEELKAANARIAELEGVIEILEDQQREAKNVLIDKNLHIDSLYEEGYKMQQRIAELEAELDRRIAMPKDLWFKVAQLSTRINELEAEKVCIDQLTAHDAIERQDDKWIPVGERLPELDQDVLAIVEGDIAIGHFYEEWGGDVYFSWVEVGAMQVATHWMPLPELPEATHDR